MAILQVFKRNKIVNTDHMQFIWECDAGDSHYIRISVDKGNDGVESGYVWFEEVYKAPLTKRLRRAWKGEPIHEMILNPENVREIILALGGEMRQ